MQMSNETGSSLGSRLVYVDGGLHVARSGAASSNGGGKGRTQKKTVKPAKPKKSYPPSTQSQKDNESQKKAETTFRQKEFVTEGNMTVIADPDLKANTVVGVAGVGKIMSGFWYVESVRHTWSREGYNMELELRSNVAGGMKPNNNYRKPPVTPVQASSKKHTVRSGDTLWDIARKYYGSGTKWRKIWEANKSMLIARDKRNTKSPGHWIYPSQVLTIPA